MADKKPTTAQKLRKEKAEHQKAIDTRAIRILSDGVPSKGLFVEAIKNHHMTDKLFNRLIEVAKEELEKRA